MKPTQNPVTSTELNKSPAQYVDLASRGSHLVITRGKSGARVAHLVPPDWYDLQHLGDGDVLGERFAAAGREAFAAATREDVDARRAACWTKISCWEELIEARSLPPLVLDAIWTAIYHTAPEDPLQLVYLRVVGEERIEIDRVDCPSFSNVDRMTWDQLLDRHGEGTYLEQLVVAATGQLISSRERVVHHRIQRDSAATP
ncbi:MAG: hypothetical protein K0Q93_2164 [Nocardioidaceae bacterium]|jgi:hypothetical protein|nr:hypothetical protein [Nocardioidaceae bacterium]